MNELSFSHLLLLLSSVYASQRLKTDKNMLQVLPDGSDIFRGENGLNILGTDSELKQHYFKTEHHLLKKPITDRIERRQTNSVFATSKMTENPEHSVFSKECIAADEPQIRESEDKITQTRGYKTQLDIRNISSAFISDIYVNEKLSISGENKSEFALTSTEATKGIAHREHQSDEHIAKRRIGSSITYEKFMGRKMPVTRRWLCSTPESEHPDPGCHCDNECILFGDCCVDAFNTSLEIKDEPTLLNVMKDPENFLVKSDPYSLESCYKHLYYKYGGCHDVNIKDEYVSLSVIDKCPRNYSKSVEPLVENKCVNLSLCTLSSVPATLTYSRKWQVVFRNIFCALCHGLDKEDVILWDTYVKCHGDTDFNNTYNEEQNMLQQCKGVFEPPQNAGKLRNCIKDQDLRSQCNMKKDNTILSDDRLACPVYLAPVKFNGQPYKNIHCAYCNKNHNSKPDIIKPIDDIDLTLKPHFEFTIPPLSNWPTNLPMTTPEHHPGAGSNVRQPSMKILFDFNFRSGFSFNIEGSSQHIREKHCKGKDAQYDYISNSCKPVICTFGREWIDGMCRYKELKLISYSELYPISGHGRKEDPLILSIVSRADQYINTTVLFQSLEHKLNEIFIKYLEENHSEMLIKKNSPLMSAVLKERKIINESSSQNTFIAHMELILTEEIIQFHELVNCIATFRRLIERGTLLQHSRIHKVSLTNGESEEPYACSDHRHIRPLVDVTYAILNDTVYLVNKDINVAYHALNTRFAFDFLSDTATPVVRESVICSLLECPQMKLSDGEFTIINDSLRIKGNAEIIPQDRFERRNGSMYICIPKTHEKEYMTYKYLHSTKIIQRVTYPLSLLALSLTIVIYVKSASVRTLHGKTLVSLSISLIGAHLTSLLETEVSHDFCKAVAIIMHFAWLAAFGWMSMISYDMLRTFFGKQTTVTNSRSDRKRYLAYSIIGWFVPFLIVTFCIILDITNVSEAMNPAYGKYGGCFIVGSRARLIFFQIPYATSVIFNTVAFILTVYSISTKRKANPHIKRSTDRIYNLIYLKLSVVMGMTWLFAILASVMNQPVFWYLHLVLNGLQGVFVFISFALRTSIWKKIKIKRPHFTTAGKKESTFYTISGGQTLSK